MRITKVIKRDGEVVNFDFNKIRAAVKKAYDSLELGGIFETDLDHLEFLINTLLDNGQSESIHTEDIQDIVERSLMKANPTVAKQYLLYRSKHSEARLIKDRIDYMDKYSKTTENASTASETDSNANVVRRNVANLEGEVYKTTNRTIQRQRMKSKLRSMYEGSGLSNKYIEDLNNHIIYTHDEASTPVLKQYCMAVSVYPLMTEGVGNIDGVTPGPPTDLQSFSGQITNLAFLLSSQCKGAVAFGEYFIALNYYVIKEFGPLWYEKLDARITSDYCLEQKTVKDAIIKAFKQFVWGINQPAGNRGFQSPFINFSYFDSIYFKSMFEHFYYPDSTQPEWTAIDTLQRLFIKWFNHVRTKQILTYPVETMALIHDGNDIVDKEYKDLCTQMYADGHSFFTYISDSADSLSSCCRLQNKITNNTFSPTSGLTGIMTGSCNVITLNINRILQLVGKAVKFKETGNKEECLEAFKVELNSILDRVHKYHIAYKTMLYEMEDLNMFESSNAHYIRLNKLYSTIGLNGLNEAAWYLGLDVSNNEEYISFLQLVLSTVKDSNTKASIHDKRRPFVFNGEVVPAESLGGKNYNWDKEDGLEVPAHKNLYNSYFFDAHDNKTSVLDKLYLHGRKTCDYADGGSACHINLDEHLSKEQYTKILEYAVKEGTNYFTFNIPNSKCDDCGLITKHPLKSCPKCNSKNITWYTRVIGYMKAIKNFGADRQCEAKNRVYSNGKAEI